MTAYAQTKSPLPGGGGAHERSTYDERSIYDDSVSEREIAAANRIILLFFLLFVLGLGGVIPPNGRLMVIVPIEDQLLVEARISPRDIAFIRPGLDAQVKITAYDYSVYGALQGKVETVSPDTIQDEVNREVFYYRAFIRTQDDALVHEKTGQRYAIVPGMMAEVDIRTGEKTVFEYLMKPIRRAQEAMRER